MRLDLAEMKCQLLSEIRHYDSKFICKNIDATAFWTDSNSHTVGDDLPGVPLILHKRVAEDVDPYDAR